MSNYVCKFPENELSECDFFKCPIWKIMLDYEKQFENCSFRIIDKIKLDDKYKATYETTWKTDLRFSENLKKKILEIIDTINLPKNFKDNLGTDDDLKGRDITIKPIQIGIRTRRFSYYGFDQFTEDDKERDTMKCDIYFFGYATDDENDLYSCIIFDHNDFRRARDAVLFTIERSSQRKHSQVVFTSYYISEIIEHCKIYHKKGKIGFRKPFSFPGESKS